MDGPRYAEPDSLVSLRPGVPVWTQVHMVSPLVVVGTRELDGRSSFAPKHQAMPLGWDNHYGFVCRDTHRTYQNIERTGIFGVTYPDPSNIVAASLAAAPRDADDRKPALALLPTLDPALLDAPLLADGYLFLECRLTRIIDGFGQNSLVCGEVAVARVAAHALRSADRDAGERLRDRPLLAYLYPDRYARISESRAFPFPDGMRK